MKYETAAAFRQALESRLLTESQNREVPLPRLRKMVAFDRLVARLQATHPGRWIVKGGFGLQLRLGDRARTTKDLDANIAGELSQARGVLARAGAQDLGDWFGFEVGEPTSAGPGQGDRGLRFPVLALLDGREFERFRADVGSSSAWVDEAEILEGPTLLEFAGIAPTRVPCYPLPAQIAEKLHAYTRVYATGRTTRVRDLIDILLIASLGHLDSTALKSALQATFEARGTTALPTDLPAPPAGWSASYRSEADQLALPWSSLDDAADAARRFLDPILRSEATGSWDPQEWSWT